MDLNINDENERSCIIPFWPYSVGELMEREKEKDDARLLVLLFVALAFLGAIFAAHLDMRYAGITRLLWIVPFALVPLFVKRSAPSQLVCDSRGLRLETIAAGTVSVKQRLNWDDISEIYLTERKAKQRVLDQYICFKSKKGHTRDSYQSATRHVPCPHALLKIKLETIGTAAHWRTLVHSIYKWSSIEVKGVDADLFNNLNIDQKAPTYTKIWLDAMLAPPQRHLITALNNGVSIKNGEYLLEDKLGMGGQGSAYLARTKGGQEVVLKETILPLYVESRIRRQALENFEHEARILGSLNHPNVVKLIDCFVEDHRGYLVLERIKGPNLAEYIAKNGPLGETHAVPLGLAMCDILSYLHGVSPPIVHRDFTPDNLILRPDGSLTLIDFTIAQQSADTATANVMGKHAYLPPEQFRGKATPQSDIYALGCTLYYLLTSENPEPLTCSHPKLVRDSVSSAMDQVVATATELEASKRFSSAMDVRHALSNI